MTGSERQKVKATVLLISGCQDRQVSRDGDFNGAFTGALKKVWNDGAFKGNYKNFRDQIAAKMSRDQIPNYFVTGALNRDFENESPFTIDLKSAKPATSKKKRSTR